jgi:hypothetical protein
VHATILVADVEKTSRRVLLQAKRTLKRANTRVLGVVINKCRWREYRMPASSFHYSKNGKQPEVDTSLVMYPEHFSPYRPLDTPASTFVASSSQSEGEDSSSSTERSLLSYEGHVNHDGSGVSNPPL